VEGVEQEGVGEVREGEETATCEREGGRAGGRGGGEETEEGYRT